MSHRVIGKLGHGGPQQKLGLSQHPQMLLELMAELGARASVAVSMVGKVKTVAQMTAISFLLYDAPLAGLPIHELGTVLVYVAAVLTLWSMVYYLRCAWPLLKSGGRAKPLKADD